MRLLRIHVLTVAAPASVLELPSSEKYRMIVVALVSLAVLIYSYIGYPILVALLARLVARKSEPDPRYRPSVSVLVPVYNAVAHVRPKLDSLLAQAYPEAKLEIFLYSDGSDDGTDEVLCEYAAENPRVHVFCADERAGKPAALNRLRELVEGEVLVLTDIRQPLCVEAVAELVGFLADPDVGCVSGNLILRGEAGAAFYWRYENWIRRSEAGFRGMVGATGPIYAIRRQDLGKVPPDTILDDMWIPASLQLRGKRSLMAPAAEAYDDGFADERELGRKVRTLAGNYQLFARVPKLLLPFVNPVWFETFSHKVLRLVGPWLLATLLVSTLVIVIAPSTASGPAATWAARALLSAQAVFYAGAALGEQGGKMARVCRTFVVLNYAAIYGLWRFVRGAQKVTW